MEKSAAQTFLSIAALAPGLTEAELKTAIYLGTIQNPTTHVARASSRQIEAATKVARRNVQYALDSLIRKHLIAARPTGGKTAPTYLLNFVETVRFPSGVEKTPLQPELPEVASSRRHPAVPDPTIDIDESIKPDSILDRVFTARPQHFRTSDLNAVRGYAYKWLTLQRGQADATPPDAHVCARLIAATGSAENAIGFILDRLQDRQAETCEYLVIWMLQKIHGIAPQSAQRRRNALKLLGKTEQPGFPDSAERPAAADSSDFAAGLIDEATAAVKKLR